MYILSGWISHDPTRRPIGVAAADAELAALTPTGFVRHDFGGDDWHVTVMHPADLGAYRWPVVAVAGDVTAVSLGIPAAADLTGGAVGMAGRLLGGGDVQTGVVPPFGLVAFDRAKIAIQQDWLGMCRIFTSRADGIIAFASRPLLSALLLRGMAEPDLSGWGAYAVSGHFSGDQSPFAMSR
jgi:asparagine synthase (glutamine-hydrolysing)